MIELNESIRRSSVRWRRRKWRSAPIGPRTWWRDVPLSKTPVAKLGEKIKDILQEHGITTLGSLSDFQAEHGDAWHQKVKGVGAETALKIADAAAEWWRQRT